MAFSAVANFLVSRWLISKARTEDSRAIEKGYNLRTPGAQERVAAAHRLPPAAQRLRLGRRKISDGLEERIRRNLPNSDVLIHLEDDRSLEGVPPEVRGSAR